MTRFPNATDVNWSEGFQQVIYYTNQVTDSWVSTLILIAVFTIVSMGYFASKKDFVEGLAVAGTFTFLIAFFFWLAEFISGVTFVFVIAVAIVSFELLWVSKKR